MFFMNQAKKHSQNWSGIAVSQPYEIAYPETVDDIVHLVSVCRRRHQRIRVIGAGHSFTPLAQTSDVLVSLDYLVGVSAVDEQAHTVSVWAGTTLRELSTRLYQQGWAQENLGDIDNQSIAGAISTGTHGTGILFGNLSTQVEEIQAVTASGDLIVCSEQTHRDWFKALQVSLGMLGIIVKVTLRVVPAKVMHYESRRLSLDECLERLPEFRDQHDHFECYWFPHTETAQIKLLDETDAPADTSDIWDDMNDLLIENGMLGVMSKGCKLFPALTRPVSKLSAKFVPTGSATRYSHELYTSQRLVHFNEMENSIPAEQMAAVIRDIKLYVEKYHFDVHFPIECRFVKADDIWLSPAYGRDSAFIAAHMYRGMPFQYYFAKLEEIFRFYQARPHWGKLHTRDADELSALYPHWENFKKVRQTLDPEGMFQNEYLKRLFQL